MDPRDKKKADKKEALDLARFHGYYGKKLRLAEEASRLRLEKDKWEDYAIRSGMLPFERAQRCSDIWVDVGEGWTFPED